MQRSPWFCHALLVSMAALAGCTHDAARSPPQSARHDSVDFPISCRPAAQADFDRAVTLLHHMTYPQARIAFRHIAERDPDCAMAHWGVAMTLFQPLWPTRPSAADLRLGWETVQKAEAAKETSAREQAFIAAAAAFFRDPDSADYWQRIQRWETAMASVHATYPQDQEAAAFYALALLASARPGATMSEHSREAVDLLQPLLRENPNHPGALHYTVHADDSPGRERGDLDVVHHYEQVAPDNPHALHMPTHIYTRLGDWDGVIRGNLRAAQAALKYPAGDKGEFVWDEFPHAIEYLVYGYLQEGADEKASAQIARLRATPNLEPTSKTAFHLSSTPARYALERRDWAQAAALVPRQPAALDWNSFPWPEGVTWFARGYGAARSGDVGEAQRAITRLGELDARADAAGEDLFARQIRVMKLELAAWAAHAGRDDETAIALARQAVELEGNTPKPPVTPAPTLPASELLGDLMSEIGRPHEAAIAYRQALQRFPRRFNGTLGAARSLAQAGDANGAAREYCELLRIAAHGTRAVLGEARDFVKAHLAADQVASCAAESSIAQDS